MQQVVTRARDVRELCAIGLSKAHHTGAQRLVSRLLMREAADGIRTHDLLLGEQVPHAMRCVTLRAIDACMDNAFANEVNTAPPGLTPPCTSDVRGGPPCAS